MCFFQVVEIIGLEKPAGLARSVPIRRPSPTVPGTTPRSHIYMKKVAREKSAAQEPLGIVISQGSRVEETPRFAAYVWGPAPEPETEGVAVRAA